MSAQLVASVRGQACPAPKSQILSEVLAKLQRSSLPLWFRLNSSPQPNCPRDDILRKSQHRCVYCGTPLIDGENATIDHLIPQCMFPSDALANQAGNRVAACRDCNLRKGDWHLPPNHPSWRNRLAYLRTTKRVVIGRRMTWKPAPSTPSPKTFDPFSPPFPPPCGYAGGRNRECRRPAMYLRVLFVTLQHVSRGCQGQAEH
ncbi:MAG: HNH endonuclease [Opitutaceae bacterium]|nr:HNH endonuclease [Opitutaceae bacterium]